MVNLGRFSRPNNKTSDPLKLEISQVIGCSLNSVRLLNSLQFEQGHRFLYFRTDYGFGKLANHEAGKAQLIKEGRSTLWAENIGLPTAKILFPYSETTSGNGILVFHKLNASRGSFISNLRLLGQNSRLASRQYACLAVDAIFRSSHLPVVDFDESRFPSQETAQSPELMLTHVSKWVETYSDPKLRFALKIAMPELNDTIDLIAEILSEIVFTIPDLANRWGKASLPHFVHNDASIKNMYFNRGMFGFTNAFLIDFEHSTATYYPVLGLLKDLADLYGGTAYNPYLQRNLIRHSYTHRHSHLPFAGGSEEIKTLMRSVILLGTLNFTQSVIYRAIEACPTGSDIAERLADHIMSEPDFATVQYLFQYFIPHIKYLDSLHFGEVNPLSKLSSQQLAGSETTQQAQM